MTIPRTPMFAFGIVLMGTGFLLMGNSLWSYLGGFFFGIATTILVLGDK